MAKKNNEHESIGPWQRVARQDVYDNAWISLHHDAVITPSDTEGIYGVVHFKNYAIGIVPLDGDNNTWLVGQHRYTLNEYSWEIPMGGGPLHATPLASAQRELQEETGLRAGNWQQLMKLHTSNSITDEVAYVFLASDLQQGEQQLEASEGDLVVKKVAFDEVLAMVRRGEITDAISVAAIQAVAIMQQERAAK